MARFTRAWSVAYWVEGERYWQFAGLGAKAWAVERRTMLRAAGCKARMRRV